MMPKQARQIDGRFLSFGYIGKLPFLAKKLFHRRFAYLLIFGVLLFILFASYQNKNGSRFVVKYEISLPQSGAGAVVEQKLETRIKDKGEEVAKVKQDVKDRLRNEVPQNDEIQQVVQSLEEPISETDYSQIFKGDLSENTTWELDFSGISKRRFGQNYQEITSADPEGRNADFFNPIMVSGRSMIIFEDYGPGILERVLLHCRKVKKVKNNIRYVVIEVDGKRMFMQDKDEKDPEKTYPFREPLFRASKLKDTGYLITFPIAYKESIRVMNEFNNGPEYDDFQAWNTTLHCKNDRSYCPLACYFAVSYNKLVHGTKLKNTFGDYFSPNNPQTKFLKEVTNAVSKMVSSPEDFGPGLKTGCQLTCRRVASGEEIVIYSAENAAQVIQSILFRLYDVKGKATMSTNWKTMLITMTWDGKEPQVKEIPLAGIFTNGFDYLREVRSLNAGVKMKTCSSHGHRANEMKARDWLAFLFYDMPFWKSAKITIKRLPGLVNGIICTQFTTKPLDTNEYNPRLTGYFSAQLQQQIFGITHNKIMFKLENQWGHVVALNFFLRNTLIAYTQENDVIIEIDQANVPTISGTGMEDYFDYVHSFIDYVNTSSAFNGVPFFSKITRLRWLRCYRHMTLDPILFTNGILIYLEGYWDRIGRKVYRKFRETSSKFNQISEPDSLLSVVLYYGSKGNGGQTTDILHYKDFKNSSNFEFSPSDVETFAITSFFENQPHIPFNRIVLSMKPGQSVTHVFNISKNNVGVILRREYRTMVPNQKAHVKVDGKEAGLWFCPQRSLSEQYSLRLHDFHLPPRQTVGKEKIKVTLIAVTEWETVSLKVVSVVLTD